MTQLRMPPNDDPTMLPWAEHWVDGVLNGWYRWSKPAEYSLPLSVP